MWQKIDTVPVHNLNVKSHMDNLGVDVMMMMMMMMIIIIIIILKWTERKHDRKIWTGLD